MLSRGRRTRTLKMISGSNVSVDEDNSSQNRFFLFVLKVEESNLHMKSRKSPQIYLKEKHLNALIPAAQSR